MTRRFEPDPAGPIYDTDAFSAVKSTISEIFDLPKSLITPGAPFADTIRMLPRVGITAP